ncbi:MAG TPA: TfuA-like protein [Gaiella sp.]|nr:TfuA-like protein [Gaiella sp.]
MEPVIVFLGPTLAHDRARDLLDAEYLGPAAHGDLLRAALRRPRAIVLVDGVFERTPAVWHKEILFALSEGIHVYGAASMGALRAAELDVFGMRGVGAVYEAYAEGAIEDDDEVAVAHADAAHAFHATSDAMVDVRATIEAAVTAGIVSDGPATQILGRVKATFYADRVLLAALDRDDGEHERLRRWLAEGWVHRKRDDAVTVLRAVAADLAVGLDAPCPEWTLQRTRYWEEARHTVEVVSATGSGARSAAAADEEREAILDELRLDPEAYRRLLDRSLLTALARNAAAAVGVDVSGWAQETALGADRRRRGLLEPEDLDAWLAARDLGRTDLPAVSRRLAVLRWAEEAHRDAIAGEVALALRSDTPYAALAERAERKRRELAAQPMGCAADVSDNDLIAWYFEECLGAEVPVALDAWATAHGWRRVADLVRALRAERTFRLGPR